MKGVISTTNWASRRDGTRVVALDPLLEPYVEALKYRFGRYWELKQSLDMLENGVAEFSKGMKFFGFNVVNDGILYREWAPGADAVYICGDFNNWDKSQHKLKREEYGYWSILLPRKKDGSQMIPHNSRVKTIVMTPGGMMLHRNPAASTYLLQDNSTKLFDTVFWNPPESERHVWKHPETWLKRPDSLRIYECHVGMATKEAKVGSYKEFSKNILPRIKRLGYTAIQVMAVAEHAYYGSFGYHVTNPFAVSSRCGTPEDLKELVDTAHSLGLLVLMDLVHSHISSNSMDGINHFDGTDGQYFHEGEQGTHREWDSRLFNYGHWEVLRYLTSNVRWWMEEYHFDGFRFDGVSSMLYKHHGFGVAFTGDYAEYFGFHVDIDACIYLMLANELIHDINRSALTIAEEVSGAPTVCQPVPDGGLGFDLRLGMGIPSMWIKLLKGDQKDEEWSMDEILHELTNRRGDERVVSYSESHDQAIVGDKTLAHWMMGDELYHCMGKNVTGNLKMERGLSLHKMIRLITYALGGDAYLNFMGNEFGHPEWIDFPREGNGFSHERARRRWDLADDEHLRFQQLEDWDVEMHKCESKYRFCRQGSSVQAVHVSNQDKVIVFERGDRLLFVFNFHPSASYTDYRVGATWPGTYEVVLDSDASNVAGLGRIHWHVKHPTTNVGASGRPHSVLLYLPARTCQVYHLETPASGFKFDPKPAKTVSEAKKPVTSATPTAAATKPIAKDNVTQTAKNAKVHYHVIGGPLPPVPTVDGESSTLDSSSGKVPSRSPTNGGINAQTRRPKAEQRDMDSSKNIGALKDLKPSKGVELSKNSNSSEGAAKSVKEAGAEVAVKSSRDSALPVENSRVVGARQNQPSPADTASAVLKSSPGDTAKADRALSKATERDPATSTTTGSFAQEVSRTAEALRNVKVKSSPVDIAKAPGKTTKPEERDLYSLNGGKTLSTAMELASQPSQGKVVESKEQVSRARSPGKDADLPQSVAKAALEQLPSKTAASTPSEKVDHRGTDKQNPSTMKESGGEAPAPRDQPRGAFDEAAAESNSGQKDDVYEELNRLVDEAISPPEKRQVASTKK
uniref:1,4-alpha-glucan branching enzyme n=3 Tax=Rhodosorus marinus TaxID=101924 RepID=A0A7S2ZTP4_9RHOD|mmetsp:Transcript_31437/g.121642  ORF Transcript_31437/g.121642 Transcript_31437/m.121642 type:complete len:1080 (+) Transcript_31437:597-3836(+)